MERNGIPIERYPFRNPGKNAGITYSLDFGEWEAAHGAGLDLWRWENGNYSPFFKAKVIAWWSLHQLVSAHREDANSPPKRR